MQNIRIIQLLITQGFFLWSAAVFSQVSIDKMLCENRENPLGVDILKPKLTWVLSSGDRNKKQSAYQIQVSANEGGFNGELVWDSDKKTSDRSVRVSYDGPELNSLQKYYWRVKVWDEAGKPSKWSPTAMWQTGVLRQTDWKAKWITIGFEESVERESPILRHEFSIPKEIANATAVITSHGLYEAFLNGERIGDAYLTPGWTSYNKRLQYQVYDVTNMLKDGNNAIGVLLGSGWYRSALGWSENKDFYGDALALLLQLNITYADGTTEVLGTGDEWKSYKSSIVSSEVYDGETIDARKKVEGWKDPGFDDSGWFSTTVKQHGFEKLVATYNEPIRKHEAFTAEKIITTPEGDKVLDFGQNLVGWVEVEIEGNSGDKLIMDHAEVLDKEGNFYIENLRGAAQQNTYILAGNGKEYFRPHFTWQGFRYVRIKGDIESVSPDNFKAFALYSDMRKTGTFTTSNELLNQLQHNIRWGQYGNFLDVPTDCPQRDERLGWTGDAQVFFPTSAFNMHVDNFFAKWMQDVAADQLENGSVPHVVPNVLGKGWSGSAGWADAATIIPWNMYLLYGNQDILAKQYQSMKSWVEFMKSQSNEYLWNKGFHFGDWLFYRPDDDNDGRAAITDKYLITQCFYAHSTQLLINAAKVLGKDDDVKQYTALLKRIKEAFVNEYLTPGGRLASNSQTAYVLALNFDMLPGNLREQAAQRLVENIKRYNYHLTTGFLGTPHLCAVLSRYGHHDLAYTLLMQQKYPSWLYPVTAGATTIWERWDGRKPDGSFQTPAMNSFNHYAYGAIGNWMYMELAGLKSSTQIGETGYKKIILAPNFKNEYVSGKVKEQNNGETLKEVNASLDTYYGNVASHWKIENGKVSYKCTVPVNTTAEIHFPVKMADILEGRKPISRSKDIRVEETGDNTTKLLVGSGSFDFTINKVYE